VHIFIIIFFILFLYGAFSTIFHSTETVGQIGKVYGETNIQLFGYLAYVNLLMFLYPLYQIYKNKRLFKDKDFYIGWTILYISLILFQALVVERFSSGTIGLLLYDSFYPLIGKAGLWLLWILSMSVGLILVLDEIPDFKKIIKNIVEYKKIVLEKTLLFLNELGEVENPFFDKKSTENMRTIIAQRRVKKRVQSKTIKPKIPKKIEHKSNKKRVSINEDEVTMLEDRPIEDIGNIEIKPMKPMKKVKPKSKNKAKPKVKSK
jgi:S-DNA-T family DNA segregation ATPase FtsK/SpoIIIE